MASSGIIPPPSGKTWNTLKFEVDYLAYVDKIFECSNSVVIKPEPIDNDFTSASKWTTGYFLRGCISKYVSTFRARVEVYRCGDLVPAFSDNLLLEFHGQAQQMSTAFCDFVLKSQQTNDQDNTSYLLAGVLDNLFIMIRARNSARRQNIPKDVTTAEEETFLKTLRDQYPSLFEEQQLDNDGQLQKCYDQALLQNFVRDTSNLTVDRLDVLIGRAFVQHPGNSDKSLEEARSEAIRSACQFMAEEGQNIISKNLHNSEALQKELQTLISDEEEELKKLEKTLQNVFDDEVCQKALTATKTCQKAIQKLCQEYALQNFNDLTGKFKKKADQLYAEAVRFIESKRLLETKLFLRSHWRKFPSNVMQEAEERGIPAKYWEKAVQRTLEAFVIETNALEPSGTLEMSGTGLVEANDRMNNLTATSPQPNSPDTYMMDPRLSERTAVKRINASDKVESESSKRSK